MTDTTGSQDAMVLERTFDAPIALVWQMWTEPKHFKAWYGPTGANIPTAEIDLRVGGKRLVCMEMETPNGPMQMWFAGEHREIVANERLVYTESMSDEDGNIGSPPGADMPEDHPETTEVIVQLEDLGGKTRMTMTHVGVPAGSPGEGGWSMAFDKLATYLIEEQGK
jgi:uncharacterized protein YndB with AHSA1/START domain